MNTKNKILLLLLLISSTGWAQWIPLNSGTTVNLHDLSFPDPDYGVIVGDAGTVLLTQNGGMTWSSINTQFNSDFYGVEVLGHDTILISDFDLQNASGNIYITTNGGVQWNLIGTDAGTNHGLDLASTAAASFALGSSLASTSDNGVTWDTLVTNTAGTTSLSRFTFADDTVGYASGLVSGIVTYSAIFYRTDDGGLNWYAGDVFSFPNADALTAMCYINGDTAMMFSNDYNGFMPGTVNGLVKLYDFNLTSPFPGVNQFAFTSQVINAAMPAWMNDGYFAGSNNGWAAGENGNIYATVNGGVTWSIDFAGTHSLKRMNFVGETAYAVGDSGTIIKMDSTTTAVAENAFDDIIIFPGPVTDVLHIDLRAHYTTGSYLKIFITDVAGKIIDKVSVDDKHVTYNATSLKDGVYFLTLQDVNGAMYNYKWIKASR